MDKMPTFLKWILMIKHLYFIFDYSKVAETIKLHKQKFCFNFQDLHSLNLWEATKEIDQRMRRFNSLTVLGVSQKNPQRAIFAKCSQVNRVFHKRKTKHWLLARVC